MAVKVEYFFNEDNTEIVIGKMKEATERALEKMGLAGEGFAKRLCPVGTPESTHKPGYIGGTLRNSITHRHDESAAYIGTNVKYGPYVELGTYKMRAQPYLKPAIQDNQDTYWRIVKQEMKNA